jgi:hypothetical protein
MSLLPPVVVGPLSVCSSSVRVQGQLIGATVDLFSGGAPAGTGVATWTDQVFPLKAGVTLAAGANVTATQTSGGVTSPASPSPVVVQKKPPTIGGVGSKTHIYECGQCLWLDGMVPGATVEVTVGGALRGKGTAADGSARIGLSPQTSPGDTLVAQQNACGSPGTKTNLPLPDGLPGGKRQLPAPTVAGPLQACQVAVTVSNVVDGAQVVLDETPAPGFSEQACFDLPSLWFQCPPLKQGSTVSAIQSMPKCDIKSASSAAVTVGPPAPVPSPTVVSPLCAGSLTVRLTGLLPGSTVEIFQDATSLGTGASPESTFDFAVPALAGGSAITAKQELCGHVSPASNHVKVDPAPASMPTPVVASPLFQCGAAVHVSNLHPGATVYVWSTFLGAPIGSQTVYTTQTDVNVAADVPVAPLLMEGDQIFATQQGCGHVSSRSAPPVVVGPLEKPAPPTVETPVENCMHSVTVKGVVPGAHVEVYVNNVWRGTAMATAATVEVALSGSLNVGDSIKARQSICGTVTGFGPSVEVISSAGFYYLTQHFTTARTGWFPHEKILTVANVPTLKNLFTQNLDAKAYAQPLYAHHVNIPGLGAHNVIYVATENDTVYAFDADTKQAALWQRSFIPPGEQVVTNADVGCPDIAPIIGITSTPVIDCSSQTMWLVAETKRVTGGTTTYHHRLYAIDISTGADRPGSPVDIKASFPGNANPNDTHGHVTYDPSTTPQMNRPALLLLGGRIYIGFGSHCDGSGTLYHGWIIAYDAATLKQVGAFCTTPDSEPTGDDMGGVWQGGMGLAADPAGFVYFMTGNGEFNANVAGGTNYGDTAVKLSPNVAAGNLFTVADYFTPADQDSLRTGDVDFGSGGPMILPDPPAGTALPQAMVACGKDGQIYLLNRQNMGKYNGPGGPNHVLASVPLQPGKGGQPGIWGGPAYFNSGQEQFIYYAGAGGPLTAFVFSGNSLTPSKIGSNPNQSTQTFSGGGSTPVVSSNQQTTGTGVVWALARGNPLQLLAFNATNLTGTPLFNSAAGPWPQGNAFTEPTVIQGKVYVPSAGQLNVFGL